MLAILAANMPFLNERFFACIPLQATKKSFWIRLLELAILYFVVGFAARFLESNIGNVFAQGWEFYAASACFFIVLAYPGFVYRYLRKRHA